MTKSERRLVAIMFTDIVGYSALTQQNERLALELLEEHNNIIRALLKKHNGVEIKTIGDSFMIEFASPLHAVQCAIAIQRSLNGYNASQPKERELFIRIGIHLGDIEHREGDVFGDGVNVASRIEPLADAGGISLTQQVFDQVNNQLEAQLESIGTPELKNIKTPLEVYKVVLPWTKKFKKQKANAKKMRLYAVGAIVLIAMAAMAWWLTSMVPSIDTLPSQPISSLAVLPFKNLSSDAENEYFSDGIAEEILNALASINGLSVRGRTSSFSFKGSNLAIPEIAKKLNVEAILEGSVRRDGNQVRITAQLIRASDDRHLWSEQFDRELNDIFAIQEEIATVVLNRLEFQGDKPTLLVEVGTDNLKAYNLYLLGLFQLNKRTETGFSKAIESFEQTIALDPGFVQAYVGLADAYVLSAAYGYVPLEQGNLRGEELTKDALELNENVASAYASLGLINSNWYVDYEKAEEYYRTSIDLDPNYPMVYNWYALLLKLLNRNQEALVEIEKALELDPLSPIINSTAGEIYSDSSRFEESAEAFERALEIFPNSIDILNSLAQTKKIQGESEAGKQQVLEAVRLNPDDYRAYLNYGIFLRQIGLYEEALAQFELALDLNQDSLALIFELAKLKEILGQWDEARELWEYRVELAGPENSFVLSDYADHLTTQNRMTEAFAQMERAIELDPDVASHNIGLGNILYFNGQFDRGRQFVEKALELEPTEPRTYSWLARILTDAGDFELAQEMLDIGKAHLRSNVDSGEAIVHLWAQGTLAARRGDLEQANQILNEMRMRKPYGNSLHVFITYVEFELGLIDEGFASLQRAYEQWGEHWFLRYINAFKILSEEVLIDPRYQEFLVKMGLAN